ncbi:MAG: hypothetical protein F6J97_18950 [Leptolyngbya sp. SIO4C1]|nr:hypothetical protein [Leptolyngbya sp. SIO4C1]
MLVVVTAFTLGFLAPLTIPIFIVNVIWSLVSVWRLTARRRQYPPTHR